MNALATNRPIVGLNSLSRLLLLRSRAHESISNAQGLELVLREASTSHITACRLSGLADRRGD